jgi:hypothetical protein
LPGKLCGAHLAPVGQERVEGLTGLGAEPGQGCPQRDRIQETRSQAIDGFQLAVGIQDKAPVFRQGTQHGYVIVNQKAVQTVHRTLPKIDYPSIISPARE